MSANVINLQVRLIAETCCNCGIPFAIPDYLRNQLLEKKAAKSFYCPNGHPQYFVGETEAQKLQRNLDWERSQRRMAEESLKQERDKLRRIENRTKNGVCPCCNRSFVKLARHMKTKHPDFPGKAKDKP